MLIVYTPEMKVDGSPPGICHKTYLICIICFDRFFLMGSYQEPQRILQFWIQQPKGWDLCGGMNVKDTFLKAWVFFSANFQNSEWRYPFWERDSNFFLWLEHPYFCWGVEGLHFWTRYQENDFISIGRHCPVIPSGPWFCLPFSTGPSWYKNKRAKRLERAIHINVP